MKTIQLKFDRLKDASMGEVIANPVYYGMPSFEDFCKNPDILRKNPERSLESVDKGSKLFTKGVDYEYAVKGRDGITYDCKTIEQAERIAKEMGFDLKKVKFEPQFLPGDAGRKRLKIIWPAPQQDSKILGLNGKPLRASHV